MSSASKLLARLASRDRARDQTSRAHAGRDACATCAVPMETSADNARTCPQCGAVEERIAGELDTDGGVPHLHYVGLGSHILQRPLERTNPGPTSNPLERALAEFAEFNTRCTIRADVAPLNPAFLDATARVFVAAVARYAPFNGDKPLVTRDGARRSLMVACAELARLQGLAGAPALPDLEHLCAVFETTVGGLASGRRVLGMLAVTDPTFRPPPDRTELVLAPILDGLAAAGLAVGPWRATALAVARVAEEQYICSNNTEQSRVAGGVAYALDRAGVATLRAVCPLVAAAGGPQAGTIKKCAERFRQFGRRFDHLFAK